MSRVVIDEGRCTGHGRCYTLASELFTDDESGHGQVVGDGAVEGETLDGAQRALAACPENAIDLID